MNPFQKELDCALHLAEAAGKLILEKRTVALANVTQKSGNEGPVTEADGGRCPDKQRTATTFRQRCIGDRRDLVHR